MENPPKAKKLLEQVSDAIRVKHYSYRTEKTYIDWIRRYILFHHKRHPKEMSAHLRLSVSHPLPDPRPPARRAGGALPAGRLS